MGEVIGGKFVKKKSFCENPACHLSALFLPEPQDKAKIRDALGDRIVTRHMVNVGPRIFYLCSMCKSAVDMSQPKIEIIK